MKKTHFKHSVYNIRFIQQWMDEVWTIEHVCNTENWSTTVMVSAKSSFVWKPLLGHICLVKEHRLSLWNYIDSHLVESTELRRRWVCHLLRATTRISRALVMMVELQKKINGFLCRMDSYMLGVTLKAGGSSIWVIRGNVETLGFVDKRKRWATSRVFSWKIWSLFTENT